MIARISQDEVLTTDAGRARFCRALIEDHYAATGSLHAAAILNDWETRKLAIRHIVPFPPATGMEAQEKRA